MGGLLPFMACMGLGGVAIMPIMCMPPPMLGGSGECCMGPMEDTESAILEDGKKKMDSS